MWCYSDATATITLFLVILVHANTLRAHGADVAQSDGANWTLFPECSVLVQSEENAWKTTGSVGPLDQSGTGIVWRGTGKPVQSGTLACSLYRRLHWSGSDSWVRITHRAKHPPRAAVRDSSVWVFSCRDVVSERAVGGPGPRPGARILWSPERRRVWR